jgi:hypothetical protein
MDYRKAAALMLRKFGPRAQAEIMARAEALLAQGDQDGYQLWLEVYAAVDQVRGLVGPAFGRTAA